MTAGSPCAPYGEAQIVVGAEVEHLVGAALDADAGVLPRGDDALRLPGPRVTDLVQLGGEQGTGGGQCTVAPPAGPAQTPRRHRQTAC